MKILIIFVTIVSICMAKVMSPEEFTDNLRARGVPEWMYSDWNCIALHESNYDTNALNPTTGDHGIFQISQIYWCSPPGNGCGVSCDSLHDDDIGNDIDCAMRIYNEHEALTGNGFSAWVAWVNYCQ